MSLPAAPFVISLRIRPRRMQEEPDYTDQIPSLRELGRIALHPRVTFLIGENGSGKSTLVEALAVASKLNPEGGGRTYQFAFATRSSHSSLHRRIELERAAIAPLNGFFLRAESVFNLATAVEGNAMHDVFQKPLHEQSHGESFLDIAVNRLGPRGLYFFDEPEAALSPTRQLSFLSHLHDMVKGGSQFLIATHSPILMAYPDAAILMFENGPPRWIDYRDTEHYGVTRTFLNDTERMLDILLDRKPEA
jgi:predicted ATPase